MPGSPAGGAPISPATRTPISSATPPGGEGYRIKWFTPTHECGVRIVTNPDKTIRDVLLLDYGFGWWQHTVCYGIFGPPVPPGPMLLR